MSGTALERIRGLHEFLEVHEASICKELSNTPKQQSGRVEQQHIIKNRVEEIVRASKELDGLYKDSDDLLKAEVTTMRNNSVKSFYDELNSSREYHLKYPNLNVPAQITADNLITNVDVQFSGAEVFGKYLDLSVFHIEYCNIPGISDPDIDYLQYLDRFFNFFHIAESTKVSKKNYEDYVSGLLNYLRDFLHRVQPLVDLDSHDKQWLDEFVVKWESDDVPGWKSNSNNNEIKESQDLQLENFNSKEELEKLGLEILKMALEVKGLKCSGTLHDRAKRLWSVRGVDPKDIPKKLKSSQKGTENNSSKIAVQVDKRRKIALIEYKVTSICDLMMDLVSATKRFAEKQQARSIEEKQAEMREEEVGVLPEFDKNDDGDSDDEAAIYNPKGVTLGWDGKPIPYWMYKLHGLNIEYKCEICGNQSYWGRRAFDQHFQQSKHAHSMRLLGIPNTKHFHDIVTIEDALALHEKVKGSLNVKQSESNTEEFEDVDGNVYSQKTR